MIRSRAVLWIMLVLASLASPARADGALGDLEIHCDQPGVTMTLDGEPMVACPGTQTRHVAAGRHQIVGSEDGFLTKTIDVVVLAGERQDVTFALIPMSPATMYAHRWPTWKPWLVLGGGLTMLGIGGLMEYRSSEDMSSYDHALTLACGSAGCDAGLIPPNLSALKLRAIRENNIAVGVLSVGVAAAAVGGLLLYLNRDREVNPALEHLGRVLDRFDVSSAPGGGMFALRGHF